MRKQLIYIIMIIVTALLTSQCATLLQDYEQPGLNNYYPKNGAVVAEDAEFWITFSEPMDTQFTETAFSIYGVSKGRVAGKFRWENGKKRLVFTPFSYLEPNEQYYMTLAKGAEDEKGNDIKDELKIKFSVIGKASDQPRLLSSYPSYLNQQDVPADSEIRLTFDKAMDAKSVNGSIIIDPQIIFEVELRNGDRDIIIKPTSPLTHDIYKINITEGLRDTAGNKLFDGKNIVFSVGGNDYDSPEIQDICLLRDGEDVSTCNTSLLGQQNGEVTNYDDDRNLQPLKVVIIRFSEEINQETLQYFTINSGDSNYPALYSWVFNNVNNTLIITFKNDLVHALTYTINLPNKIEDINKNNLAQDYKYQFRMGTNLSFLTIQQLRVLETDVTAPVQIHTLVNNGSIVDTRYIKTTSTLEDVGQKPEIEITFSDAVDVESFLNALSISPDAKDRVIVCDTDPCGAFSNTITIRFNENLAWNKKYTFSLKSSVKSYQFQNPMENDEDFYITIGGINDYPVLLNARMINGKDNTHENIALDETNIAGIDFIEKTENIELTFNRNMDVDSIKDGILLTDYNTGNAIEYEIDDSAKPVYVLKQIGDFKSNGKYRLQLTDKTLDVYGKELDIDSRYEYLFNITAENSSYLEVKPIDYNGNGEFVIWRRIFNDPDYGDWQKFQDNIMTFKLVEDEGATSLDTKDWLLINFNKTLDIDAFLQKGRIKVTAIGGNSASVDIDPADIVINTDFTAAVGAGTSIIINKMTFNGVAPRYELFISKDIEDEYGNKMKEDYSISFALN